MHIFGLQTQMEIFGGTKMNTTKQVIVMRRDLKMRRGKEIAQGSHATMAFLTQKLNTNSPLTLITLTSIQRNWLTSSFRKVCVRVNSEEELCDIVAKAKTAGIEVHLVIDDGLTEFKGISTPTCAAIGPDYDERIDQITGHLELY